MLNVVVYIVYIESVGRSPSQLIESSGEELGHKKKTKMHRLQLHRLLGSSGPLFAFCLFISMQFLSFVCNTKQKVEHAHCISLVLVESREIRLPRR